MKKRMLAVCLLGVVLSGLLTVGVLAGGPGVDGRSVTEPIVPQGVGLDAGIQLYRSGWTTVTGIYGGLWVNSQHYSNSDLMEHQISVSGRTLRNSTECSTCSNTGTNTSWATCTTTGCSNRNGVQVYTGESVHSFHTDGYVDSVFTSWQQRPM